eukprot:767963-Hanusia_phi.AAC.2
MIYAARSRLCCMLSPLSRPLPPCSRCRQRPLLGGSHTLDQLSTPKAFYQMTGGDSLVGVKLANFFTHGSSPSSSPCCQVHVGSPRQEQRLPYLGERDCFMLDGISTTLSCGEMDDERGVLLKTCTSCAALPAELIGLSRPKDHRRLSSAVLPFKLATSDSRGGDGYGYLQPEMSRRTIVRTTDIVDSGRLVKGGGAGRAGGGRGEREGEGEKKGVEKEEEKEEMKKPCTPVQRRVQEERSIRLVALR